MLTVKGIAKTFNPGTPMEQVALRQVDLFLRRGDYVSVIGGNGSGKSTLLNCIAGVCPVDRGSIIVGERDLTRCSEHKRARVVGRVFQDPMMGTSAALTIEENLALALRRGSRRGLSRGVTKRERLSFIEALRQLDLGLDARLETEAALLSGGQRQALTLLMAVLTKPQVLLLDEHTAALDPKTVQKVLGLTDRLVKEHELTTLMVTHNMRDAIKYGNRLIMMHEGSIILDIAGEAKRKLTVEHLLNSFGRASGEQFSEDRALLA